MQARALATNQSERPDERSETGLNRERKGRRKSPTKRIVKTDLRNQQSDTTGSPSDVEFQFNIDAQGRQKFNFEQEVWIDTAVPMAHTPVYSLALKTLAINLLTMTLNQRTVAVSVGLTSKKALTLASAFSKQCLLGAPGKGWILPRVTIEAWLQSRRRNRKPATKRR